MVQLPLLSLYTPTFLPIDGTVATIKYSFIAFVELVRTFGKGRSGGGLCPRPEVSPLHPMS
jgi:hypothetical protein